MVGSRDILRIRGMGKRSQGMADVGEELLVEEGMYAHDLEGARV